VVRVIRGRKVIPKPFLDIAYFTAADGDVTVAQFRRRGKRI
jgi:hypothetical protein